jgi:hypothetical protein
LSLDPYITLTHYCPQIDAEPTDMIGDLKAKIQKIQGTQGHWATKTMNIVYSGTPSGRHRVTLIV